MSLMYGQLPESTPGAPQPRMACRNDQCEAFEVMFSADRSDYWFAYVRDPVLCYLCEGPMSLCQEVRGIRWLP